MLWEIYNKMFGEKTNNMLLQNEVIVNYKRVFIPVFSFLYTMQASW